MRGLAALVFLGACIYTSADTDGRWSALDDPCVPVGPAHKIADTRFSVITALAGDTLLYSSDGTVSQLDLATGTHEIVLRSDGVSQVAPFGNNLVYYESNGDPLERRPIDVIVDRGARSTSRYQRVSPRPGQFTAGLVTTANGVYWWTASDGFDAVIEEWRWTPDGGVEPFVMDAASVVRADATQFFYFDRAHRLIVRPQLPGPPTLVVEMDEELPTPMPIAIDGDEVFYVPYRNTSLEGDLVARGADGVERVLVSGQRITNGAIDPSYVYFTQDCAVIEGTFDARCENLYRVPRAGGPIQTVFDGDNNTTVFGLMTDACNVYWQQFTIEGGALYAGEITP